MEERIALHSKMNRNLDPETIGHEYSVLHHDLFPNENNQLQRCPGLSTAYADMNEVASVDGLYYWKTKGLEVSVCNGKIFSMVIATSVVTELTGDTLTAGVLVHFQASSDGSTLVMCAGGKMVTWDGIITNPTAFIADVDAPTAVVDLAMIDRYLLAVEKDTGKVYYSGVADVTSWEADDFFVAEQSADDVKRVITQVNDVDVIGADSIEWWEDDGETPFVYTGISLNRGTIAPDSVVVANKLIYFLDQEKQFIKIQSRSWQVVSTYIQKELSELSTVSDAYAYTVNFKGHTWIYLTFPTEKVTYVYDYVLDTWHKRGLWNATTVSWEHFLGRCFSVITDPQIYLVGDRKSTGLVYQFSSLAYSDVGDHQRLVWESGNLYFGTSKLKIVNATILKLKRGVTGSPTDAYGILQMRDDNGVWNTEEEFSLGAVGEKETIIDFGPTGEYVTRQYRIVITEDVDVKLISMTEDFDVGS